MRLIILFLSICLIYGSLVLLRWENKHDIIQKWTINIDTPNGPSSASSNTYLNHFNHHPLFSTSANIQSTSLNGEIPFIRSAEGKYIFASVLYRPHLPTRLYADHFDMSSQDAESMSKIMESSLEVITIPKEQLPILFTFEDINNHKTLREVDPIHLSDFLGEGYSFKSMTIEGTSEEATHGLIYQVLPWLKGFKGYFNKEYKHPSKNQHYMRVLNRLDLNRRQECKLDVSLLSNLSLGYYRKGYACKML